MADYIHVPFGAPSVLKLNIMVQENDLEGGALKLLKALRPHWSNKEIQIKLFTDGITNKLLACYVEDMKKDVVLVRVYGNKTELFVDRDNEVKSFLVLHAHDCAPELYCTFNNGLCYAYMHGTALDPDHVRDPKIFSLIAKQLAKFHSIHAHNGWIPKSNLWSKMGKYFKLIPTEFEDEGMHNRFLEEVPSHENLKWEMTWMKEYLSSLNSPIVLCHNDLLCKNIIFNEQEGV